MPEIDASTVAAWWGAVVSTAVLGWNIFVWLRSGPRLVVQASGNMIVIPRYGGGDENQRVISMKIENRGSKRCQSRTYDVTIPPGSEVPQLSRSLVSSQPERCARHPYRAANPSARTTNAARRTVDRDRPPVRQRPSPPVRRTHTNGRRASTGRAGYDRLSQTGWFTRAKGRFRAPHGFGRPTQWPRL